jgi:hypothetical protein
MGGREIAGIVHGKAQILQRRDDPGRAQGGGSHDAAAAPCPRLHRRPQDRDPFRFVHRASSAIRRRDPATPAIIIARVIMYASSLARFAPASIGASC